MKHVRVSKALVIDDDREDGLAAVRALSYLGISSIYVQDFQEYLDSEPESDIDDTDSIANLFGIRLILLDFDIEKGLDDSDLVSLLNRVIKSILREDNGPYVILGWTNMADEERIKDFVNAFNGESNVPSYMFDEVLQKGTFEIIEPVSEVRILDTSDSESTKSETSSHGVITKSYDIKTLANEIQESLNFIEPLGCIMDWENRVIKAANSTIKKLSSIAQNGLDYSTILNHSGDSNREIWLESLRNLIRKIAETQHGKDIPSGEAVIQAFCEVLNPLLSDVVDWHTSSMAIEYGNLGSESLGSNRKGLDGLMDIYKLSLRSILNISIPATHHRQPRPGDVYDYDEVMPLLRSKGCFLINTRDHSPKESIIKECLEKDSKLYREKVLNQGKRILLDITPLCDYSTNRVPISRFVVGLIVPSEGYVKKNRPEYTFVFGPVVNKDIRALEVDSHLIFNYLRLVSMPITKFKEHKKCPQPIFRISGPCLARIQTLFGGHAIRQGIFE